MKKTNLATAVLILLTTTTACNNHQKQVTISRNNNGIKTSLEYSGSIVFNNTNTAIESMTNDSYIKFKTDSVELYAERGYGPITYQLNSEPKTQVLNANQKKSLAIIIRQISQFHKR